MNVTKALQDFHTRTLVVHERKQLSSWVFMILGAVVLLSFLWLAISTLHWSPSGDASLIRYARFLIEHGLTPYRDVGDYNFPGAYFVDWGIGHTFGEGALVWRVFDLALCASLFVCFAITLRAQGIFSCVWALGLFACIHGRDGLDQLGQRDLSGTVFAAMGLVLLLYGRRKGLRWPFVLAGICWGMAAMIKPTLAVYFLLPFSSWSWERSALRRVVAGWLIACLSGLGVLAGFGAWLRSRGSLYSFLHMVHVVAPYHATLGDLPVEWLMHEAISPVGFIAGAWVAILLVVRLGSNAQLLETLRYPERVFLFVGTLLGLISYLIQGKGFTYQRYPFLAFLLILISTDLTRLFKGGRTLGFAAALVLGWGALVLAPASSYKASQYDWKGREFETLLSNDLSAAAGKDGVASLSGEVQCLDTISGCLGTLLQLRIVQSTGTIYDEFLFHSPVSPVVDEARSKLFDEVRARPPKLFVITPWLFPAGPGEYRKLDAWPEFRDWLLANYSLYTERQPVIPVRTMGGYRVADGYRVYALKPGR